MINIHTKRHIFQLKNKPSALWWTNDVKEGMSDFIKDKQDEMEKIQKTCSFSVYNPTMFSGVVTSITASQGHWTEL